MKKIKFLSFVMAICLMAGILSSCGPIEVHNEKLTIVTTIFPEYDWVMQLLGDKAADADVTMLLDSGVDLHSFQPTADDIIKISTCDIFIYVGGESDKWVDDALKEVVNKNMIVLDLLDILGDAVKEEEVVEGMEGEEEEGEDEEEEPEYDEHVWLSLKNAATICRAICDAMGKQDAENKAAYEANLTSYLEKINALDAKYTEMVSGAQRKTILFGDRFPFRYLADDYDLDYYAAFVGCSAESEASFETIAFLANKVKELALPVVLTLEGTDHKIAETVVSTSKMSVVKILAVDSLQSATGKDWKNGVTYLSIMEKNLEVLREALN